MGEGDVELEAIVLPIAFVTVWLGTGQGVREGWRRHILFLLLVLGRELVVLCLLFFVTGGLFVTVAGVVLLVEIFFLGRGGLLLRILVVLRTVSRVCSLSLFVFARVGAVFVGGGLSALLPLGGVLGRTGGVALVAPGTFSFATSEILSWFRCFDAAAIVPLSATTF